MKQTGPAGEPLLQGEGGQSDLLEDAEHWARVYEELSAFLDGCPAIDADKITAFHSRLEYWLHRRDELTADNPTDEAAATD